jgi:hypothetical protein
MEVTPEYIFELIGRLYVDNRALSLESLAQQRQLNEYKLKEREQKEPVPRGCE